RSRSIDPRRRAVDGRDEPGATAWGQSTPTSWGTAAIRGSGERADHLAERSRDRIDRHPRGGGLGRCGLGLAREDEDPAKAHPAGRRDVRPRIVADHRDVTEAKGPSARGSDVAPELGNRFPEHDRRWLAAD